MATMERTRDIGRRNAQRLRQQVATELRDARLTAGVSQERAADAYGLSQSTISRLEQAESGMTIEAAAALGAVLGYRLSIKLYPDGSPVRDAGQLQLIDRLRSHLHRVWRQATEVLVGTRGDLRAWDLFLSGPGTVGIDAETRLYDLQAIQRRCEAKARDSGVDRIVLLVADTRHNRRVLREHREALRSTFPLDTRAVMTALRAGELPSANGVVVI